jgi:hypothetical protein
MHDGAGVGPCTHVYPDYHFLISIKREIAQTLSHPFFWNIWEAIV